MTSPKELKYSKKHEWVKLEGDAAIVGISDFAQQQLTDIVFVELPEKGKKVEKDKQLAVVESVKSVSDVFSPVSGELVEANEELANTPEVVNQDPYGKGWIAKIKLSDKSELDSLMSAEEYEGFIKKEGH
ncbi:glycine cleavage system protein GcvH [Candidatus Woesearchaeota archaeon]|nr:glycine cleavage system protein GcvH [Candidatus Woesearchaeota archaeon]